VRRHCGTNCRRVGCGGVTWSGVVWYATRRVNERMGERLPVRRLLMGWRRRHCAGGTTMFHLRLRCSPRSDGTLARIVDVRGVAAPHGSAGQDVCLGDGRAYCPGAGGVWRRLMGRLSVSEIVERFFQGETLAGGGGTLRAACPCYICGTGDRQRSDITRARSVDVLGVAAPHGPAVVWYAIRRVHAR
ncbi:hypothetical protein TGGT1_411610, partial [Toxoplasma gondii GT1]